MSQSQFIAPTKEVHQQSSTMWFYYIPNHLKAMRLVGGFPIALDPASPKGREEDSKLRLTMSMLLLAFFCASTTFIAVETYVKFGNFADSLKQLGSIYGFTPLTTSLGLSLTVWTLGCYLIGSLTFILARKNLCQLYEDLSVTRIKLERRIENSILACFILAYVATLLASCLVCVGN